jgi:hypothetical protein
VLRAVRKLTPAGQAHADSICAAKAHLERVRRNTDKHREERSVVEVEDEVTEERAVAVADLEDEDEGDFAFVCREGVMKDLPDKFSESDDLTAAVALLDVHNYLQRDVEALFESAFLSLRSDSARDPRIAGYDMTIPPANHREAMM